MDRQQKIVSMFDEIAKSYDLANRVLSFGSDIMWRKRACRDAFVLCEGDMERIVDVACGTGDMLGFWHKEAQRRGVEVKEYLGIDPSQKMLDVAQEKFPEFHFLEGFAQELPLESESADIVSITYGIRNVVERQKAIEEFARVLKPGGVLVILEFTKRNHSGIIDNIVQWYMKKILPMLGGMVSGNRAAYEYLPNSIDNFLTTEQLIHEIEKANMVVKQVHSYSFGISTTFIAQKDG